MENNKISIDRKNVYGNLQEVKKASKVLNVIKEDMLSSLYISSSSSSSSSSSISSVPSSSNNETDDDSRAIGMIQLMQVRNYAINKYYVTISLLYRVKIYPLFISVNNLYI